MKSWPRAGPREISSKISYTVIETEVLTLTILKSLTVQQQENLFPNFHAMDKSMTSGIQKSHSCLNSK